MVDPSFYTVIVPYAKSKGQPERISVMAFTKEGDSVELSLLKDWKYSHTVKVTSWPTGKLRGRIKKPGMIAA